MRIEVLYRNQRYEEFDTSVQTCPEPYRAAGTSILSEWILCLGALEEQGVLLEQHWYDASHGVPSGITTSDGTPIPAAIRKIGRVLMLVSPDELGNVIWLRKDGEKLLWREGDDLINGERFFAMEQLCYSDEGTKSINRRALAVFDYLKNSYPNAQNEDLAESMGYTLSVIDRIRDAELAQNSGFEEIE